MIYKEYLKASERHLQACKCLMSRCLNNDKSTPKSFSKTSKSSDDKLSRHIKPKFVAPKYILPEIYYLSGYVIECIVNYGLYYILGYDKQKDVKNLTEIELYAYGYKHIISYGSHIRGHDFQHNLKIIRSYIKGNWPNSNKFLDSIWGQTKTSAFQNWNVNVRYEELALTEKDIQDFFQLSEQIYTEIRNALQNYK
jgi:hypothetical protein